MSSRSLLLAQKETLRHEIKNRWALFSSGVAPKFLKERLQDHLGWWLRKHPGIWATYRPLKKEADPLVGPVTGIQWAFPRMAKDHLEFVLANPEGSEPWMRHRWGIEEPPSCAPMVARDELTGILIPGLAFDLQGARLGRGAGFYDRTLMDLGAGPFAGIKVGIAYGFQMVETLPMEPHDVRMDVIVTEQSVFECGGF